MASRVIWLVCIAFGSCWHLSDIFREYLSFPVFVDIVLKDPEGQQIPHFSICFDFKEYLHATKTMLYWYNLHVPKHNLTLQNAIASARQLRWKSNIGVNLLIDTVLSSMPIHNINNLSGFIRWRKGKHWTLLNVYEENRQIYMLREKKIKEFI